MEINIDTGHVRLSKPDITLVPGMSLDELTKSGVVIEPQAVGEICEDSGLRISEVSNLAKSEHRQEMHGMTFLLTVILKENALASLAFKGLGDFIDSLGLQLSDTEMQRHKSHRALLEDWLGPPQEIKGLSAVWHFRWGDIYTHYDEVRWGGTFFVSYASN